MFDQNPRAARRAFYSTTRNRFPSRDCTCFNPRSPCCGNFCRLPIRPLASLLRQLHAYKSEKRHKTSVVRIIRHPLQRVKTECLRKIPLVRAQEKNVPRRAFRTQSAVSSAVSGIQLMQNASPAPCASFISQPSLCMTKKQEQSFGFAVCDGAIVWLPKGKASPSFHAQHLKGGND